MAFWWAYGPSAALMARVMLPMGDPMTEQLTFQPRGRLFFGDNLEVLRRHVADESVDLVYLDPPFNSNRSYNVLFARRTGRAPAAQVKAFDDTWKWDTNAARTYQEVIEGGGDLSRALRAFHELLGSTDMLAYFTMMAPRLLELRRVMKPTASLYLHCDPTASHYLKVMLDATFGPTRFRSEIVWRRTSAHSDTKQGRAQHGRVHDVILYYTKSDDWTWNPLFTAYSESYAANEYRHQAPDGRRYKEGDVTAAKPGGDTSYAWRVKRQGPDARWEADLTDEYANPIPGWEYLAVTPYEGRYWAYSKAKMAEFAAGGKLIHRSTGAPRLMLFADEMPGIGPQDLWTDIPPISSGAAERLGYPTQKPIALLKRIIAASSNEGDVVLDPFCGCGTTVDAAQTLKRNWIGVDITEVAIQVIRERLKIQHAEVDYITRGEPSTVEEAEALAALDKHEFQRWALEQVGVSGAVRKGADRGIDGEIIGMSDDDTTWRCIISVKGGGVTVSQVRDLRGTIEREGADIGVLISMKRLTSAMKREAADAGFTKAGQPRIQVITVEELLDGKQLELPARRRRLRSVG